MTSRTFLLPLCLATGLTLGMAFPGTALADASGAKALFEGQDEKLKVVTTSTTKPSQPVAKPTATAATKPKPVPLAIMTWVKLVDETGGMQEVSPTRTFKSGERIRLNVRTNKNGYLYVVSLGSSGRAAVLFPQKGQSNYVKAGNTYETPDRNIQFDSTAGEEEVMFVVSEERLEKVKIANVEVPTASDSGVSDSRTWQQFAMATGSKDLLVEDDPGTVGASPALYVAQDPYRPIAKSATKPLTFSLKLKHQ